MTTATAKFDFNEWHKAHRTNRTASTPALQAMLDEHWQIPRIECADGFNLSVQASRYHYCSPRETGDHPYSAVEVGFPSERVEVLMPFCESPESPTDTVYGYVPVDIINDLIESHGGPR